MDNTVTNDSDESKLSKEEKLKKRREQLALWRQKKEQDSKNGEKEMNSNATTSSDDKQKLRQQRMEEWKKKRAQETKIDSKESVKESPKQENSIVDDKLKQRQQRIEEWKKKRAQESNANNSVSPSVTEVKVQKPAFQLKRLASSIKKQELPFTKKRILFDEEEEDESKRKPKFKKPTLDGHTEDLQHREDDPNGKIDELDDFIASLSKQESSSNDIPSQIIEDEQLEVENEGDSEDEEIDQDKKQQELLSSKFQKLQNEKQLETIDHSTMNYSDFRKNFYQEPSEIQNWTAEQVESIRLELDGIKVAGSNVPRPVLKWSHLGLPASYMNIIEDKLEYKAPTSIQSQALPAIMSGRDIIGVAKTGSGKTLSFVLPMLRHIQDQPDLKDGEGPIGLILSPTRELAVQIHKEITNFTKRLGMTACCCYGGSPIESQIAELKKGAQILVGTPGRIIELLAANSGRITNLRRVTYVVLDEADRMFDLGFEPQVTKISSQIRPESQTVLFSATFPRKIELLAKRLLYNPLEIIVGGISVVASEITQKVELFEKGESSQLEDEKFDRLLNILDVFSIESKHSKVLIFVEKQSAADDLLVKLLGSNHPCLTIHGGKDQIDRKYAIKEFSSKDSGVDILIATSIAARGLDVKGLDLVINYDPPNHMEDYVHRVGRTGRAGMKGTAITFVSSDQERSVTDLVRAMTMSKIPEDEIPSRLIEIRNQFLEKVKAGKFKYSFGFGGKGLEKLQQIRDSTRSLQKKEYGPNDDDDVNFVADKTNGTSKKDGATSLPASEVAVDLPDFQVIEGRAPETSGPDKSKFHSRITINDLPQRARWFVVNRDSLSKIIESTSTSITNKGQYYAPNVKVPQTVTVNGKESPAPPRLYLLVEGLTEQSVREANSLIRDKMIEGLEVASKESNMAPTGKYKV
ncbi:hypothetical protein G9P44_000464 [Scheffersomyces stipitis]|nr:hypothetical protein G9P44_000464 [Scheffersomyces stipitis]